MPDLSLASVGRSSSHKNAGSGGMALSLIAGRAAWHNLRTGGSLDISPTQGGSMTEIDAHARDRALR